MNRYVSNTTLVEVARWIRGLRCVGVTTHAKPDGDAIGSTVGLVRALNRIGIETRLWYLPPFQSEFRPVVEPTPYRLLGSLDALEDEPIDGLIITDTGALPQLGNLGVWLRENRDRTCVLDHHIQGDDIAAYRVVNPEAAAASEVVADLLRVMEVQVDEHIATPLYLGIATDTGWFRFSNVRAKTFRYAAAFIDAGVNHATLYRQIEQNHQGSRLLLLGRALNSMEFLQRGRIALLKLRLNDYRDTGASQEDTHGFSDIPQSIGKVEVVCLLAETEEGYTKLSLRSKHGPGAVDVNSVALKLGGGGHARAAGARLNMRFADAEAVIREMLADL